MSVATDCFGIFLSVGNQVMFSKGAGTKCVFTQGKVDTIGKKYIHIAEVDFNNTLVRNDNNELIIHKRLPLGVIRVFTEAEQGELNNDKSE